MNRPQTEIKTIVVTTLLAIKYGGGDVVTGWLVAAQQQPVSSSRKA
jgi:hypothetical protein